MSTTGFHSEWITIDDNRVLIECRAGFPSATERFIAKVACEFLLNNATRDARVVSVYYDDKACTHTVTVASTDEEDQSLEEPLLRVLHGIYNNGNCRVVVEIVPRGDRDSDHYNHMEHVSVGADVAVNRWKHSDETYQAKVRSPR